MSRLVSQRVHTRFVGDGLREGRSPSLLKWRLQVEHHGSLSGLRGARTTQAAPGKLQCSNN